MLIVESLLLLLTEDSGRPEGWSSDNDLMLRGALLSDLMLAGRIEADTARTARRPRMRIVDTTPTGHPVLDDALAALSAKNGKRIASAVTWDDLRAHDAAGASLVKAGVLAEVRKRECYLSPSVKRRKKSLAARKNRNKRYY